MIPMLKEAFGCLVAFSDHTPGRDMDIAAAALGADIIEKTITLDRTQRSCEHMFSLEPHELSEFVVAVKSVQTALGNPIRILSVEELERRTAVKRSAYLNKSVKAGDLISADLLEFKRPGYGISPDEIEHYLGRAFSSDMEQGSNITDRDLK